MFIKRINKIYAPPKTNTFTFKNVNKKVQSLDKISSRNPKNQLNNNNNSFQKSLKILTITIDPHANYICFYSQQYDTIYIISILTLLDYIDTYRMNFNKNNQYSFKTPLKPDLQIQNPRPSLNIFQIKFSHSIQNTQFLIIAYYTGIIDIYSVITGKKLDGVDIMETKLNDQQYQDRNINININYREVQQNKSPIYNVNVIGHSIFISTYDGKMLCYEGRQLRKCNKFEDQWIRFCYDQYQQINQNSLDNNRKPTKTTQSSKLKKLPIYQTKSNCLYIGNNLLHNLQTSTPINPVQSQKQQHKSMLTIKQQTNLSKSKSKSKLKLNANKQHKNIFTQSYIQYLKLQSQKLHHESMHRRYTLSLCQNYLICYDGQNGYTIRNRQNKWTILCNFVFGSFPVVNQFWGLYKNQRTSKNKNTGEKVNFIEYCLSSQQILIALKGDYQISDKLLYQQNQTTISIIKIAKQNTIHYKQKQKHKQKKNRYKSKSKQKYSDYQNQQINQTHKQTHKQKQKNNKKQDNKNKQKYKLSIICKIIQTKYNILQIYWIGPNILLYLDQNGNVYYVQIQPQILMKISQ